jgi:hypothetical protein
VTDLDIVAQVEGLELGHGTYTLWDCGEETVADVQMADGPRLKVGRETREFIVGEIDVCQNQGELSQEGFWEGRDGVEREVKVL